MKAKELAVLMVEPGKHPEVTKIKDDLDSLQKRNPVCGYCLVRDFGLFLQQTQ